MSEIGEKTKFTTILYVIAALVCFMAVGFLYFWFSEKVRVTATMSVGTGDKYYYKSRADQDDPMVTKTPSLKNILAGPIISADDPSLGDDIAPLTIVEFADFSCTYCHAQEQNIKKLIEKYPRTIRLVWKDYPERDENTASYQAAIAARCAFIQNKFWPFHDRLFEDTAGFTLEIFEKIAADLNLDLSGFRKCLAEDAPIPMIENNIEEADALAIQGIPFLYINNQEVMGEASLDDLEKMVISEMDKNLK